VSSYDPNASITFNLGARYTLNTIYLWNCSVTGSDANRDVLTLDVRTSADGVNYSAPTGLTLVPHLWAEPAQAFPLSTSNVQYVKLTMKTVNGGDSACLSEVRFGGFAGSGPALVGVLPADAANVTLLTNSATGTFADPQVGSGKTVTVSGLALNGTAAGNYLIIPPTTTANITTSSSTLALVSSLNPTMLGNPVTLTAAVSPGVATGTVTFKDGVTTLDTGVLSGGTATVTTSTLTAGSHSLTAVYGGDANVAGSTSPTLIQNVTAAGFTNTTTTVASSSTPCIYGNNVTFTATVAPESGGPPSGAVIFTIDGVAQSPVGVIAAGANASATFSTNALPVNGGVAHTVSAAYNGENNYNPSSGSLSGGQTVAAKALSITGITANNKVYDRTNTVTLSGTPGTLVGKVGTDAVALTGTAVGVFADVQVGSNKTVTVSGQSLTGAQAANYALTPPTLTATITGKALTVSGITARDKVYDGTPAASLVFGSSEPAVVITPTNAIATSAVQNDPNPYAAPWNVWNGSALTKSGGDAGILTWTHAVDQYGYGMWQASGDPHASITLVLGGAFALNKMYLWNGTQTGSEGWSRKIKTVDVSTSADGVTFSTPTNLTLTAAATNAVEVTQEFPLVAANVTQVKLHVTSVYGGDTVQLSEVRFHGSAGGTSLTLAGVLAGDTANVTLVTNSAIGAFADPNVGTGKIVTVAGLFLSGSAAGNYTVTPPTTTANIIPEPALLGLVGAVAVALLRKRG
ncbi:MAG: YDG domain-containing protein, partial [bacterium]|nr:YDG domain-containing protein [bacterium]